MHDAHGSDTEEVHDHEHAVHEAAASPKLDISQVLNMRGGTRKFSIDLFLTAAKHCSSTGEPVPQEHPYNQQIFPLIFIGQDKAGELITVEASGTDLPWLQQLASSMHLGETVTLDQPTFSSSK